MCSNPTLCGKFIATSEIIFYSVVRLHNAAFRRTKGYQRVAQFASERKLVRVTILNLNKRKHAGFGRLDLMAMLAVVFGLVVLFSAMLFRFRHPPADVRCADNLRELGVAMALYEKDNNERLPYADRKSVV